MSKTRYVIRNIVFIFSLCVQVAVQTCTSSAQENANSKRTDSFETKMKLLEEAWRRKDFDLARSLTHSLRDTVIQTQIEEQSPGLTIVPTSDFKSVQTLATAWRDWAHGWSFFKTIAVEESTGEQRKSEPVEVLLSFPADQVQSLAREVRVAVVRDGKLVDIPSQVFHEVRRGDDRFCTVIWMVDCRPYEKQNYLLFYGNPNAELPEYPSDLLTEGEGFGLDISNAFYQATLSRQTGQLERLTLRREHGLELFSGGQGHGEPPGIDWAHDYVDDGSFQKLRISLWDTCPDYEVIRGPICTIVRRWGFPYSPVHPVFSPSRLSIFVEYRFYTGLPWFHKFGSMRAVQSFQAEALRDDEWVFSGQSFTDKLWMGPDGKLRTGDVDPKQSDDLWGVGFFHQESKDAFMALFLEHKAEGLPELKHTGSPMMFYRWHGHVWSRYPLPVKSVPKGAVLHQKNAYVATTYPSTSGAEPIESLRRALRMPLSVKAGQYDTKGEENNLSCLGRLARPGEAGDGLVSKQEIWRALRDCKDAQLYTADINVVDLGLVDDVRVRGNVVTLIMSMPHRGRPRLGYFIDGSISVHPTLSVPVRERIMQVPGVKQVVVQQTWEPGWSSHRLTDEGRKKLGLK